MNKFFFVAFVASLACIAYADSNPDDVHAVILKLDSDIDAEGNYHYAYETSNKINVQEQGVGGHWAKGDYSYYSPEGENIQLTYTADENGFQPTGSYVAPIPEAILKALEYIRTHPQYDETHH